MGAKRIRKSGCIGGARRDKKSGCIGGTKRNKNRFISMGQWGGGKKRGKIGLNSPMRSNGQEIGDASMEQNGDKIRMGDIDGQTGISLNRRRQIGVSEYRAARQPDLSGSVLSCLPDGAKWGTSGKTNAFM